MPTSARRRSNLGTTSAGCGAWAGACDEQEHGRLPPLLVTSAETPSVYAWPEQKVELHCRPSQAGGCRWLKGSRELGTECRLSTTERGMIRCVRGEETCGTVTLKNPSNQQVEHNQLSDYERRHYYYSHRQRYWDYNGETQWNHKSSTFLCSRSGTIILKSKPVNQTDDEVECPCRDLNSGKITPSVSGVRVCVCPEPASTVERLQVRVSAEKGAFLALSVADIVVLERSDDDEGGECALLGQPAHGRYEPVQTGTVKLSCDPGYSPSCSDPVRCSDLQSGTTRLSCVAAKCPSPPAIPNTKTGPKDGTGWGSVVEYSCATGYTLYPSEQNTTSTCGSDSLWSLGHVSCVSETDIRVVAMRLGEQHARSMAALRAELETLLMGQRQLLADQNSTQQRLSKLEREVALLALAEGAYLPAQERDPTEDATEPAPEEEGVTQTPEAATDRAVTVVTKPEQQPAGAADSEELGEGTAETTPPSDVELIPGSY
ncbi:hypothetical protein FJT64_000216 [Amphibalanus amphitrite]|uniref:Sushi domain-containing protein n=1 Tax=Amphibalanus amphitrite TaxID=1232801 RepID=A0A6A4X0A0_AMPAM|nr:hypothetical protein FJT64_000216 [Amphibalanus amphitrite]